LQVVVRGVVVLVRLKALVVVGDGLEDYGDLLAVGRAEAKRMLRTHENVNVKDILYSAKCGVHIIVFEVPDSVKVVADPPKDGKMKRAGFKVEAKLWE
jgi:hypothetical protein